MRWDIIRDLSLQDGMHLNNVRSVLSAFGHVELPSDSGEFRVSMAIAFAAVKTDA